MKKSPLYLTGLAIAFLIALGCSATQWLSPYKLATDERSVGSYIDDTVVKTKIQAKLLKHKDEEVRKAFLPISVSVHRGKVVMVGEIPTKAVGDKALQIALDTKGVRKVDTYFFTKGPKSTTASDTAMAAKVKTRFLSDVDLKGFQVEVSVVHAHVVLAGVVANQFLKKRCLDHASRVKGVVKVVDFIQLK